MHIANFTPDTIPYTHVGLHGKIEPGQIIEVDTAKGNHILNKLGDRGLMKLEYGDSDDNLAEKKKLAMEVYTSFWMKQIENHNQHNVNMRNENKHYIRPQRDVAEKAKELGVDLEGPWKLTTPDQKTQVEAAKKETDQLKIEVSRLQDTVNKLVEAMTQQTSQGIEDPLAEYKVQFLNRSKANLKVWAKLNQEAIKEWPEDALEELKIKWITSYGENPTKEDEIYPF